MSQRVITKNYSMFTPRMQKWLLEEEQKVCAERSKKRIDKKTP